MTSEAATSSATRRASTLCLVFALAGCARPSSPPVHPVSETHLFSADPAAPQPNAANAAPPPSANAPKTIEPSTERSGPARKAGWIVLSIGASVAAVAIGSSILMLHEDSVRSDECNAQKVCSQAGLDANSRLKALGGWNAGLWAVGAVGVGVGAFLVIANPPRGTGRTAVGLSPNGSGMAFNLRSTF